jgi:hypothetical protein
MIMLEPYHDYMPAGKQNVSMACQLADTLGCWHAVNTECKLAGLMVSQTANQTAGRLTCWHDGWPARRQDFTVKKPPKHCIGETSEHFLSLPGRSTIGALNIPGSRAEAGLQAAMPLPVSGARVEKCE